MKIEVDYSNTLHELAEQVRTSYKNIGGDDGASWASMLTRLYEQVGEDQEAVLALARQTDKTTIALLCVVLLDSFGFGDMLVGNLRNDWDTLI